MKTFVIDAQPRSAVGTRAAGRLRKQGLIPINLYGGEKQHYLAGKEYDVNKILSIPDALIVQLNANGNQHEAVLQEVQFHPVSDKVTHIDLIEIHKERKITMQIPVRAVGVAAGAKDGGQVIVKMRRLKVRGLLKDLPDHIDVPVEPMKIGDSVKISDLSVTGLQFMDPSNGTVVRVQPPRVEIVTVAPTTATAAATAATPEGAPKDGAAPTDKTAAPAKEEGKKEEEKKEKKEKRK